MCEPATTVALISAALAAGGTAASIKATKDVTKARNAAAANELLHKQKVAQDAQGLFQKTAAESAPVDAGKAADLAAQDQYAATRQQAAQEPGFGDATQETGASSPSASPVVKEAAARSLADALQVADSQVKARATLRGLDLQRAQRGRQLSRANQQATMLGGFDQGWGRVGVVGQQAALGAGDKAAMLGDVLTGLGQVGMAGSGAMAAGGTAGGGGQLVTKPAPGLVSSTGDLDAALFRSQLGPNAAAPSLFAKTSSAPMFTGYY